MDNLKIVQADAMNMHYLTIVGHKFPEKKKKKEHMEGQRKKKGNLESKKKKMK